ncbi:hypothetical protein EIP86_001849 [Pleurotus ostreatoroseus]|nr:hypothetical protein EIP86_001849 [Pleurotus ostreatoroseus]
MHSLDAAHLCSIADLFNTFRIAANPSVTFFVIVNPNSGPGKANTQPDPVYSGCMEQVKASNVIFLGYVDTKNGKRASSAITQDVATYAGWESAYAVAGIFFDDVTATKKLFSDYSGWAATAKSSVPLQLDKSPSSIPANVVSQLVTTDGIASFYYTDLGSSDPYANLPDNFATFVSMVAADS